MEPVFGVAAPQEVEQVTKVTSGKILNPASLSDGSVGV